METLLGVVLTGLPFIVTGSLLALANRRERRRQTAVNRQIALTDAIHARLGAAVAPVVRSLRGGRWQVDIAVPFERPAVVASVLTVVDEAFALPGPATYEVVLRPSPRVASLAAVRASRAA
jgi:hypothetical protein